MDSKLELTKSQLETILRLINDSNLNSQGTQSTAKQAAKSGEKSTMKLGQSAKKRSYSTVNLKNATSTDELINESFRKSISNLIENSRKTEKFPEIRTLPNVQQSQTKLKRNKSLIELKKEKWDRERNELKDSDSWYEKFDSFKKFPINRSRSQPDILLNYNVPYNQFDSVSRMYSPVSHFDDESNDGKSIALSNAHSRLSSQPNLNRYKSQLSDQFNNQPGNEQNADQLVNEFINQPRRSFHRYAHQLDNINLLEKRRKQQEYQAQLEAQLAYKRELSLKRKEQQRMEDFKLEEKLMNEQAELRKEFEIDHLKGELVEDDKNRLMKGRKIDRRTANGLKRLEMKSKELIKVFVEASTQTDDKATSNQTKEASIATQPNELHKWHSPILQPVQSNRSVLLRTINKTNSKWTKQSKGKLL